MIKGGFQGLDISGVDLTAQSPSLPGAYAACAAADGKTVLVLTAAGAVQCSVKKVSTNYVLAGITGDGKILSIAVGATDGIEVIETEIPSGEETQEYLDNPVNIKNSTSAEPYVAEYDGFAQLRYTNSEALANMIEIYAKSGPSQSVGSPIVAIPAGSTSYRISCFVKKGTKLYFSGSGTNAEAYFFPYKPVHS